MSNKSAGQDRILTILASASPRRTELLSQVGMEHLVIPSGCEEKITSDIPHQVVMELSVQKAVDVYNIYRKTHDTDFQVIGADTVVALGGIILGKPVDEEDAYRMISLLQGNEHQVYTGVTILRRIHGELKKKTFFEVSQVEVFPMTEEEIRAYIATGEPMDKAGAYGIQGQFAVHVQGIRGDYNNIVGLPIARIYQELKSL